MCILSDPEGRSPHGEDGDSRLHRSTGRSSGYGRSGESANQLLADRGHCLGIPKHLSTTLQTPLVVFIVPASGHNVDRLIYILNVVWQCSVCLSVCLSVSVFPVLTLPPPPPPQEHEAAVRACLQGGLFSDVIEVLHKLLNFMDLPNTVCILLHCALIYTLPCTAPYRILHPVLCAAH